MNNMAAAVLVVKDWNLIFIFFLTSPISLGMILFSVFSHAPPQSDTFPQVHRAPAMPFQGILIWNRNIAGRSQSFCSGPSRSGIPIVPPSANRSRRALGEPVL
jgi:hypothetical protein